MKDRLCEKRRKEKTLHCIINIPTASRINDARKPGSFC